MSVIGVFLAAAAAVLLCLGFLALVADHDPATPNPAPACDTRTQGTPPCRRPATVTVTDTQGLPLLVCPGHADEGTLRGWWQPADRVAS